MENPVTVSSPLSRPTDSDRRGLVVVVAIFFIVIIIISIGIQILIRRRGASQSFDWLLYIGAVLMLAHSACYAYSVSFGLGLPKEDEDIDVNAVHKVAMSQVPKKRRKRPINVLTFAINFPNADNLHDLGSRHLSSLLCQTIYVYPDQAHKRLRLHVYGDTSAGRPCRHGICLRLLVCDFPMCPTRALGGRKQVAMRCCREDLSLQRRHECDNRRLFGHPFHCYGLARPATTREEQRPDHRALRLQNSVGNNPNFAAKALYSMVS